MLPSMLGSLCTAETLTWLCILGESGREALLQLFNIIAGLKQSNKKKKTQTKTSQAKSSTVMTKGQTQMKL